MPHIIKPLYQPYDSCETHDEPGECTIECVTLISMMSGDGGGEMMEYGDYLGGVSSVDVSGCHRSKPMPELRFDLDTERRMVVASYEHPEDCQCDSPECPVED